MAKFLLDNFVKSKLENVSPPYSEQGWTNMEKMLDKANGTGSVANTGLSFGSKFFIASGVVVISTAITLTLINTDTKNSLKSIEIKKPIQNEVIQTNVKPCVEVPLEFVKVDKKKPIIKTTIVKETFTNTPSPQSISQEVGNVEVKEIISSVTEKEVVIASDVIAQKEVAIENKIEVQSTNSKIETKENSEYIRPTPVPAKDIFKKKKRGFFSIFGNRR